MTKLVVLGAATAAAAVLCPLCVPDVEADARVGLQAEQAKDTATVRLHISGMTCGTCPATARVALRKLPGVFSAVVTYEDSLGVVRYDPARLTPAQIAAHLTKLTGYRARPLPRDQLRDTSSKAQPTS